MPAETGRSSAAGSANSSENRPSPTAKGGYALAGVSNPPNPEFHAFRQDLADVALVGQVIASHYAEPLLRHLVAAASLHRDANVETEIVGDLRPGDEFLMLDDRAGWAWGYAGPERRVGYLRSGALGL